MNQLVPINPNVEAYRASTDAAAICREIVLKTAVEIQKRRYVKVEGWQAIAIAHGCAAGARDVEKVDGGVRAIGEVRRMTDGGLIATGEGFVGEDEATWYGGEVTNNWGTKTLPKRSDYAIRAMAQTRAISRACRSAFAHVVVMMDAGLSTTPAEEVPFEGFDNEDERIPTKKPAAREKLDGPHTSKTALRNAVNAIIAEVRAAQSADELDTIKSEHKRTINQALRDWPSLINGDPNIEEDIGLKGAIELRRQMLGREDDAVVSGLIESMKQCDTLLSLTNWRAANEEVIDALDGAEGRTFELAWSLHESSINEMDKVSGGA